MYCRQIFETGLHTRLINLTNKSENFETDSHENSQEPCTVDGVQKSVMQSVWLCITNNMQWKKYSFLRWVKSISIKYSHCLFTPVYMVVIDGEKNVLKYCQIDLVSGIICFFSIFYGLSLCSWKSCIPCSIAWRDLVFSASPSLLKGSYFFSPK